MNNTVLVAGATGNLGGRIVDALIQHGANVRVLVRSETEPEKIAALENKAVRIFRVERFTKSEILPACEDVQCVVSALSGLSDVIIDAQTQLLEAAVEAQVPRFVPSVFSLDFTHLVPGTNRNLDLRREFETVLDRAPIAATSIFNGAFMELLTGQMPLILFPLRRILVWGHSSIKMDFTTMDDVAQFTARVALDEDSPRTLRIAGDSVNARDVKTIVSGVTGHRFGLLRAGGIGLLNGVIKIAKTVAPAPDNLYPAWQGMQYLRDMMEGRAVLKLHDNGRYPAMKWTRVPEYLASQNVNEKL